ncbi:MAG TPA: hypothetical protein VHX65_01045 [Pirellulales bacterium]|jgi:hypothetical protein|nr:hypothetical protein [Pirellulales bacterium]
MIVGDLVSGAAKLAGAMKDLRLHWTETQEQWRDIAARRFEEEHLVELEPLVRMTFDAVSRLAETLDRAQRECS